MSKFKAGDKVKRAVDSADSTMPVGSIWTVKRCESFCLFLEESEWPWDPDNFELVEPAASAPGVVYEVGKTYSYLNNVRTCIGFTSKGLPVFERPDGTVFEKGGGVEFKEVVKPLVGKLWANIYGVNDYATTYSTRADADRNACHGRIACVEVNWTEGEGL